MRKALSLILVIFIYSGCLQNHGTATIDHVIADGQMPNVAVDKEARIHLVYGSGDSLLYAISQDKGKTFSSQEIIAVLPGLYSFATRGPQIAVTNNGVLVTAATSTGNIFSFYKTGNNKWLSSGKVNDRDTIAKEGLMSLSSEENNAFAVWLDLRNNNRNNLYGARSNDGGKTWSKNIMVYTSPDSSICECCKPSVVVKDHNIYVMFRNWLNGSRDLYLITSSNGGQSFEAANKLGNASWQLNGCPMDGGAIAITNDNTIQTVWRRENKIYSAMPGMPEKAIGEGKGCTLENTEKGTYYTWFENGSVVVLDPQGKKITVGKGIQPVIKAIDNNSLICVWENNKQLHSSVINL